MSVVEGEWLDLAADLLSQPLQQLSAEPIACHLAITFSAAGCAFSQIAPDGVVSGAIYPPSEQFNGHRAELEVRARSTPVTCTPCRCSTEPPGASR